MQKASSQTNRIRDLNDAFRKSMAGDVVNTHGVAGLPSDVRARAIRKVATFDAFTPDNDPHGEHDFGSFDLAGQKFFWKIDYYDLTLEGGSEDPSDPKQTTRVLTIMRAEVIHRQDIGMIQHAGGTRFLLEASNALAVVGKSFGQHLDSYVAAETRVARAVHLTHSARAEWRQDLVWTEFGSNRKHAGH